MQLHTGFSTNLHFIAGFIFKTCTFHSFRVGHQIYVGTHTDRECNTAEGCQKVTITHAWVHTNFREIGEGIPVDDIAMAK